jgi:regulator of replication initiation timing
MAEPAEESMDWLRALEKRVTSVTAELADLRKKNRSLVTKVNRLERRVREDTDSAKSTWAAKKSQIQARVEGLAENLEQLLEE